MTRPDWPQYFMQMAELASTRSTCLRRKVGAVLVKDNLVIATGYNGPPMGVPHCEPPIISVFGDPQAEWEVISKNRQCCCVRTLNNIPSGERHELCRGLHAEQNAIIQAARLGHSTIDTVLYTTFKPCIICMKMIINAGILQVIYKDEYPDELTQLMAKQGVVRLIKFEE